MKQPESIVLVTVIIAVGIGAVLFQFRPDLRPESPTVFSNPATARAQAMPGEIEPGARHTPARALPTAMPHAQDLPEAASEVATPMVLNSDDVLATVNGRKIQLADLIALGPGETEKTITSEQYESRLNRAIEMELTFQAARSQSVSLTAEQQKRLRRIERDHESRLREYKEQGISWSSVTSAQLEFEKRLMSALMLQQNLVAKEAQVAPSPNPALQARYEQAVRDLLARLKAAANITASIAL
jgi:hypothetical protein